MKAYRDPNTDLNFEIKGKNLDLKEVKQQNKVKRSNRDIPVEIFVPSYKPTQMEAYARRQKDKMLANKMTNSSKSPGVNPLF